MLKENREPMRRFRKKPDCGTYSGYDYHIRQALEEPCDDCREAMRAHWRKKRQERGPEINRVRSDWRHRTPGGNRANTRRARKFGVKTEKYSYQQVLDAYGSDCHICDEPIDLDAPRGTGKPGWERALQVDHVIPLSKGGDDTLENVRPSHGQCNNRKNAKILS